MDNMNIRKINGFTVQLVADGVYAIDEFGIALMYLIIGKTQALLLDTGVGAGNVHAVVKELTDLPCLVVNSHHHYDHHYDIYSRGLGLIQRLYLYRLLLAERLSVCRRKISCNRERIFTILFYLKILIGHIGKHHQHSLFFIGINDHCRHFFTLVVCYNKTVLICLFIFSVYYILVKI